MGTVRPIPPARWLIPGSSGGSTPTEHGERAILSSVAVVYERGAEFALPAVLQRISRIRPRRVTVSREPKIPLSRPDIGPLEQERVAAVLSSGRLALGPVNREFEMRMAGIAGARHAVGTSSGTAALHAILVGLGIGPGDEVITTPYSFVATANAALYVGATPVFADIDRETLNMDPERVEARVSARTRAIIGVDVFGIPADWTALQRISRQHDLRLIDDGCEALGANIEGRPVGSLADATAFGFYPNKQITTGEGGCITTDNAELAEICRSLCNQGRATTDRMHHVRLGYNYRLSDVSAAIGCAQLERFDELQARRLAVAGTYEKALQALSDDVRRPPVVPGRSWFAYVIVLSDKFSADARDQLIGELSSRGIASAPYFPCIHLQPLYRERFGYDRGGFPVAEAAAQRSLALPFFTGMTEDEVAAVVHALKEVLPSLPRSSSTVAVTSGV